MSSVKQLLAAALFQLLLFSASSVSADTPNPTSVTVAGSLQSEIGCPGDWQPDCSLTHLAFDLADQVWQGTFNIPAGNWEYKAALNNSWDENYGMNATLNGPNIPLTMSESADVKFYYSHATNWITSRLNSVIAVAAGSFQSELGCTGDWQPDGLCSWLQDPDGDGIYTLRTNSLPAGDYEVKVAINEAGMKITVPAACKTERTSRLRCRSRLRMFSFPIMPQPEENVILYAQWSEEGQGPVAIPTLSEWGMILMSLMLAGTAVWMLRRQQIL
jgi:hypothetical protein